MTRAGYLHLDGDLRHANGIDRLGLRSDWNQFWNRGEPQRLAEVLQARAINAGAAGSLLSLPSTALFTAQRVAATRAVGLRVIVLFGSPENCVRAFLERERRMPQSLTEAHWHRNNDHVHAQYVDSAFDAVRMDAFKPDGSRWPRDEIVDMFMGRLA